MDFREFRRYHKSFLLFFAIVLVALAGLDAFVVYKRHRYVRERERLRAGMNDAERRKTDLVLGSEDNRLKVMMALLRRQAQLDKQIHLAVAVDSGSMYLEREGALLREIPVRIGPERRVGTPPDTVHMVAPRGERTVERVLGKSDGWEVPAWVYMDRGLPVPAERSVKGALGPVAILLTGGTVIYAPPSAGPLNDSSYVLPGAVRASAVDLRAIVPNLKPGTAVYFY
ncbi:MAG: hypothetical protein WKG32_01710 [Gemmatimonadaceae bacterium]